MISFEFNVIQGFCNLNSKAIRGGKTAKKVLRKIQGLRIKLCKKRLLQNLNEDETHNNHMLELEE